MNLPGGIAGEGEDGNLHPRYDMSGLAERMFNDYRVLYYIKTKGNLPLDSAWTRAPGSCTALDGYRLSTAGGKNQTAESNLNALGKGGASQGGTGRSHHTTHAITRSLGRHRTSVTSPWSSGDKSVGTSASIVGA